MKVYKVEQHLNMKVAILHNRHVLECYAELPEGLGIRALSTQPVSRWVQPQ
jgi:hypothetical protein